MSTIVITYLDVCRPLCVAGLSLVAGHILLQTPEEDAFWTFVALMDNHLRGYFSPAARLMEIDSMLFEKALYAYDKSIAVRLFVCCYIIASR